MNYKKTSGASSNPQSIWFLKLIALLPYNFQTFWTSNLEWKTALRAQKLSGPSRNGKAFYYTSPGYEPLSTVQRQLTGTLFSYGMKQNTWRHSSMRHEREKTYTFLDNTSNHFSVVTQRLWAERYRNSGALRSNDIFFFLTILVYN